MTQKKQDQKQGTPEPDATATADEIAKASGQENVGKSGSQEDWRERHADKDA
jgi:hypothetical protein